MRTKVWAGWVLVVGALLLAGCEKKSRASTQAPTPSVQDEKAPDVAVYGKGPSAKICPVSKEKIIGDMGRPYECRMADGKRIMLCCPSCRKTVDKNPAKYAAFFY